MRHQTHHHHLPFFFQLSSATPTTSSLSPPLHPLRVSSSQVEREMECVEAAFIRKEMAMKPTQTPAVFVNDLWPVNVPNGDDFVDEFLNFSNENEEEEEEEEEEEKKQLVGVEEEDKQVPAVEAEQEVVVVVEEHETTHEDDKNSDLTTISSSFKDEFCSVPADDELASLEWLSHIVDDSNSEYSAPFPAGILPHKPLKESQTPPEPEKDSPCFKSLVPGKARSKRRRNGIWVSPLGSTTPLNESSSCSTTSSSSSSTGPWVANYSLPVYLDQVSFEKPLVKKQKKKPACDSDENVMQQPRRCSHCGVTKTPQWRAGPLGAKTLCNACGVRYKSGRLFPEYRPACSPTFSSELHSNHHRKVLEMRKKKEVMGGQLESGLAPSAVPSF